MYSIMLPWLILQKKNLKSICPPGEIAFALKFLLFRSNDPYKYLGIGYVQFG